jgi:GAF domain-containing protein
VTDKAKMLARLARLVAADDRREALAERLAEACRLILNVDGAAITVENTTLQRMTLYSTNDHAARLEDLQEVLGEGPSQDAFTTGAAIITTLDERNPRWRELGSAVRRVMGAVTVHAMPMRPGGQVIGVLSLHTLQTRDSLPQHEPLEGAQFLADAVGAALLNDPPEGDGADTGPWSTRAEIHQATGMVIAQLGLHPQDALAILRAHAYAHDATLADIARQVVNRDLDFGSESSEAL